MNRGNHFEPLLLLIQGVNNILHVPTTAQKAQHLIVTYLLRHVKILVCPIHLMAIDSDVSDEGHSSVLATEPCCFGYLEMPWIHHCMVISMHLSELRFLSMD